MKAKTYRRHEHRVLAAASVIAALCLGVATLLGIGGQPEAAEGGSQRPAARPAAARQGAAPGAPAAAERAAPSPGRCVRETCNDDWTATGGVESVNQDPAGCVVVRSMLKMQRLGRGNLTGHWCKARRAVRQCRRRDYDTFVFRDEDTALDVHAALRVFRASGAAMLASYKSDSRHVGTNWFVVDTRSRPVCAALERWWAAARWHHPEHDQHYFNRIFRCGSQGLRCVDKRGAAVHEVHCRSALGTYRSHKRQACMRYAISPKSHLL